MRRSKVDYRTLLNTQIYGNVWEMSSDENMEAAIREIDDKFGKPDVLEGGQAVAVSLEMDDRLYIVLMCTDDTPLRVFYDIQNSIRRFGGVHCIDREIENYLLADTHQQWIQHISAKQSITNN